MNTSQIKNFAIQSRNILKTGVLNRILTLGFDKREDLTKNALHNLTESDPDTIVTACPLCKSTFGLYSDRPVEDIAETVDKHTK